MPKTRLALALCVVVAYGALAYSALREIPPLAFLIPFALVYASLINFGSYFLNLQVFLDVVSRGPRGARGVALTFDDGPHPTHTREVLDVLDEFGAKATFFVIGEKAAAQPELVREIARRGHDLAIHSYTHDRLLNMRNEKRIEHEIAETSRVIEELTGQCPKLFRPPVGFTSPRTTVAVRALGMTVVGWTTRAYDGLDVTSSPRIVERISPDLSDGAIVLLHDSPERGDRKPASVGAVRGLLEVMRSRGLEGVAFGAWLADLEREGSLRKSLVRSKAPLPLA